MSAVCLYDKSGKCTACGRRSACVTCLRECVISSTGHEPPPAPPAVHPSGCTAGAELKRLLANVGITATPDCACNARAAEMDRQGCDWCEANVDTIVGWLREQAQARGLPFLDAAGRMLVKRAIRNARRNSPPPAESASTAAQ